MRRAVLAAFVLALTQGSLPDLEQRFLDLRELHDRLRIAAGRGAEKDTDGAPLAELRTRFAALRRELSAGLRHFDRSKLTRPDQDALQTLIRVLGDGTVPEPERLASRESKEATPDCSYDPVALARRKDGLSPLKDRIYDCYSQAARHVSFEGGSYDRLTILEMAGRAEDPVRRRRLFLALEPVFRSVNGDDGAASPYRAMLPLSAAEWAKTFADRPQPRGARHRPREAGTVAHLDPRGLARAQRRAPSSNHGTTSTSATRAAEAWPGACRVERLKPLNDAFYRSLGADVDALARPLRPRAARGQDGRGVHRFRRSAAASGTAPGPRASPGSSRPTAPAGSAISASCCTRPATRVHIAAIRTRPAYRRLARQRHVHRGARRPGRSRRLRAGVAARLARRRSEPQADSLRTEVRRHRAGRRLGRCSRCACIATRAPTRIGSGPSSRASYLHVRPHPELSWWALRGQLVDSPGYMMNYALGAIITADLRARCQRAARSVLEAGRRLLRVALRAHLPLRPREDHLAPSSRTSWVVRSRPTPSSRTCAGRSRQGDQVHVDVYVVRPRPRERPALQHVAMWSLTRPQACMNA